ncbi:hypothetical protein HDF08_003883 [Edaphobacter lichenicola]|uniref:Uncharacterized protein n=1 Tax=Tunturiibacter lichenicola TaxID=2051959 RepID=A0A852VMX4_9BACT|nr:hypothetical protein [Edaphobacter lichenicola]
MSSAKTHCAWGGHFVTCIPLRVVLPLVAMEMISANRCR